MNSRLTYLILAFICLVGVLFVLPFYSVDSYSILRNTSSHLGAQHAPNAWIMNVTFAFLGIASILSGWRPLREFVFHRIVLICFGLSLVLAALFQHRPIIEGIAFSVSEDKWHSIFASATGFSFTLLAISTAFICTKFKDRAFSFLIGISATGLSILMFILPDLMGLWQRVIFLSSFSWIIYILGGNRFTSTGD